MLEMFFVPIELKYIIFRKCMDMHVRIRYLSLIKKYNLFMEIFF